MNGFSSNPNAFVYVWAKAESDQWTPVWIQRRLHRDDWQHVSADIPPGVTALQVKSNLPTLSLANFDVQSGICRSDDRLSATFEPGHTQYLLEFNDPAYVVKASEASADQLPKVDMTTETGEGHYLTTRPFDAQASEDSIVRLSVVKLAPNQAHCLSMQVYSPDSNRDLIELRLKRFNDSDYIIWTSQSLFSVEQNVLEADLRQMNQLAKSDVSSSEMSSPEDAISGGAAKNSSGVSDENDIECSDDENDGGQTNNESISLSNQGKRRKRRQRLDGDAAASSNDDSTGAWINTGDEAGPPVPNVDNSYRRLNGWHLMKLTIPAQTQSTLEMSINRRTNGLPTAIDDISLMQGVCQSDPNCDFDPIQCPITQASSNGQMMLIGTGRLARPSKVFNYEPVHSPKAMHKAYAYLDATNSKYFDSKGRLRSNWAQINSEWLQSTGSLGACFDLTFFVQKPPRLDLRLSVHQQDRGGSYRLQTIRISDDQTNGWYTLQQTVIAMERFRLGVRLEWIKSSVTSAPFFAIDYLRLSRSGICTSIDNQIEEEEDFACDFDESFCGWTSSDWRLASTDRSELDYLPRYNEYGGQCDYDRITFIHLHLIDRSIY